jgi:hypothetical protein
MLCTAPARLKNQAQKLVMNSLGEKNHTLQIQIMWILRTDYLSASLKTNHREIIWQFEIDLQIGLKGFQTRTMSR